MTPGMKLPPGATLVQEGQTAPMTLPPGATLVPESALASEQHPSMGHVGDFMAGVGAGGIGTVLGAYELLRKIPGADKVLPPVSDEVRSYAEPPDTVSAKVGKFLEGAAEFAIPGGAAAEATKGAGLLARAAAQAGTAGAVRAAQTGGNVPQSLDAAALGAAGPVAGAALKAAAPIIRNVPGTAFDAARVIRHPTPTNILRMAQRVAGGAAKVAKEAAPEAEAAAVPTEDEQLLEAIKRGQANAAAQAAVPPKAYQPRPPEYYGVTAAEVPPTTPAPSNTPVAQPPASAAAPAKVMPIRPEPETPPPTPAEIAKSKYAEAKADRFVDAIQRYNRDFPDRAPITSKTLWSLGDEQKGILTQALKSGGYLGNSEKFTNTSFPYIVDKLRTAEAGGNLESQLAESIRQAKARKMPQ